MTVLAIMKKCDCSLHILNNQYGKIGNVTELACGQTYFVTEMHQFSVHMQR